MFTHPFGGGVQGIDDDQIVFLIRKAGPGAGIGQWRALFSAQNPEVRKVCGCAKAVGDANARLSRELFPNLGEGIRQIRRRRNVNLG